MEKINDKTCHTKLKDGISVVAILEPGCQSSEAMKTTILKAKDEYPSVKFFEGEGCENCDFVIENMITAVPSMVVFKDGKVAEKVQGHHSEKTIFSAIEKVMNS